MERPSIVVRGLGALLAIVLMTGIPEIEMPDFQANKVDAKPIVTPTEQTEMENENVIVEPNTNDTVELPPTESETEEPIEIETETETEIVEETLFFDVPLSEELQLHIFAECEKHNIAPAIIIAMIEKESSYRPHIKGDNGNSYGLMQIMQKYQKARMEKLGCTDLLDPFQNVTVGIDLVAELRDKNDDLYWVLMAYNGGQSYANKLYLNQGKVSKYALYVTERASELERELYGE